MSNKMAMNTYLPTTESKKLSKQEQRLNHGYGAFQWLPVGKGVWGNG